VNQLNLSIRPGERVLLVGPSGAGKSTLLHGLAGVLHQDEEAEASGELLIDGEPAAIVRGRAGLVQQDPETQVVQARVGDDVAFGAENLAVPADEIWPRVEAGLAAVGLDVALDAPTSALSGGQKQRLALAGILAMRPGLVLLDEPTANLDPEGVVEVRDAIVAALESSGATMVIVEHRLEAWAEHVDQVVVLEPGGGVSHHGTPAELFAPGPIREQLQQAGIWVPGYVPELPPRGPDPHRGGHRPEAAGAPAGGAAAGRDCAGPTLLAAVDLSVARRPKGPAVLEGIDLGVAAGSALCLTGHNGSGKSTVALTLAGLLPERAGAVVAYRALAGSGLSAVGHSAGAGAAGQAGTDVVATEDGERPYAWKAAELVGRIGTVFQEPEHQFVTASVQEELEFGPRRAREPGTGKPLFSEAEIAARVDGLLGRLRLGHLRDANPFTLSGGEKRRLSVATVLAAGPRVLILDEPTFGQDANTWRELALLLREQLDEGAAVIAVTHDGHFAAALGAERHDVALLGEKSTPVPHQDVPGRVSLEADNAGRASFFGRAHPLAKLVGVAAATIPLVATLDVVSAGIVVAASALVLPLAGISPVRFAARAWPLLLAGLFAAWGTALVGNDSGAVLANLGLFTITEGSLNSGLATGLRAFAIAVPSVLLLSSTDPSDLASALAQKAKLPHRFVLGALAGMRLMGLLTEEWKTLGMARRARGVGANGNIGQRAKANLGQGFGLLVQAIRRASRLAVTMEAKGFGRGPRTWARPSTYAWSDAGIVLGGAAVGALAVGAAVLAGTWNLVWG
jgi:energy-coupling factor transport system ATP-binding protein